MNASALMQLRFQPFIFAPRCEMVMVMVTTQSARPARQAGLLLLLPAPSPGGQPKAGREQRRHSLAIFQLPGHDLVDQRTVTLGFRAEFAGSETSPDWTHRHSLMNERNGERVEDVVLRRTEILSVHCDFFACPWLVTVFVSGMFLGHGLDMCGILIGEHLRAQVSRRTVSLS